MNKSIKKLLTLLFPAASTANLYSETIVFRVDKMMCGSCTSRVKKTIQSQPGTSDVSVTLEDHLARFTCSKDKNGECNPDEIAKQLKKIGYPAKLVTEKN
jgi:copper chaperone CopZ